VSARAYRGEVVETGHLKIELRRRACGVVLFRLDDELGMHDIGIEPDGPGSNRAGSQIILSFHWFAIQGDFQQASWGRRLGGRDGER
jgi:hypothetical protein